MYPQLNGKVTPKSLPPVKSNVHPQFFEIALPKFSYPPKKWKLPLKVGIIPPIKWNGSPKS